MISKKDRYGLEFRKVNFDGNLVYQCRRINNGVNENNLLLFLDSLDSSRTEFLLKEIDFFLIHTPDTDWDPYDSMVLEHIDLKIRYPEFIIDGQPETFPLADIRDLLQEWLEFLKH